MTKWRENIQNLFNFKKIIDPPLFSLTNIFSSLIRLHVHVNDVIFALVQWLLITFHHHHHHYYLALLLEYWFSISLSHSCNNVITSSEALCCIVSIVQIHAIHSSCDLKKHKAKEKEKVRARKKKLKDMRAKHIKNWDDLCFCYVFVIKNLEWRELAKEWERE